MSIRMWPAFKVLFFIRKTFHCFLWFCRPVITTSPRIEDLDPIEELLEPVRYRYIMLACNPIVPLFPDSGITKSYL